MSSQKLGVELDSAEVRLNSNENGESAGRLLTVHCTLRETVRGKCRFQFGESIGHAAAKILVNA